MFQYTINKANRLALDILIPFHSLKHLLPSPSSLPPPICVLTGIFMVCANQ